MKENDNFEKIKEKKDRQNAAKAERKIKIVGDSIGHSINFKRIEKEVGKVSALGKEGPGAKYDRAYGSQYDHRAQFPNNNPPTSGQRQSRHLDHLIICHKCNQPKESSSN